MKFVNYVAYVRDEVAELRPVHRAYAARLMAEGKLVTGGPFLDGSGALFIYEAASLAEADTLVRDDPYTQGGAIASYALSEWQMISVNLELMRPSTP